MDKKPVIALIYDFDGTLAAGNMQEYDFTKEIGCESAAFWEENKQMSEANNASEILCYMKLMLDKSQNPENPKPIVKDAFKKYGQNIPLYRGVPEWFDKINKYGDSIGVKIEHYINSSGLQEIIEGTSISNKFEQIYASRFMYDDKKAACWPAVAVDFTNKTQYLYMINKGINAISQNKQINNHMDDEDKRIPFSKMIYFGDGETDVPCMKLLKQEGGYSIAVYQEGNQTQYDIVKKLINRDIVNFACPADYSEGGMIFDAVKAIIHQIKNTDDLEKKQNENKNNTKNRKPSSYFLTKLQKKRVRFSR